VAKASLIRIAHFLVELIDQDGGMTMPDLADALADATGVQAHPDAIGRFMRKLGFTYKKRRWSRPNDAVQG
jgi:transposase